jgi:hypothetical protein
VSNPARTRWRPSHLRTARRAAVSLPVVAALVIAIAASPQRRADATPRSPECTLSALHFTFNGSGGLGHGWYVVVAQNVGTSTCTLAGYPRVRVPLEDHVDPSVQRSYQRVAPPHSFAHVVDALDSYAGGYSGPVPTSGHVTLPVMVLAPRRGVASFTIEWGETSPKGCSLSRTLRVRLLATTPFVSKHQLAFMCSGATVTPFVRGSTGTWT